MVCSRCGNDQAMYCARCFHSSCGRTAGNTVGTQPTDVQKLKAEIAALIPELRAAYGIESTINFENCLEQMRQLSAV